ncbi:MAG: lysophospholipid acyltransferase family protein [Actinomycetota bacterium]
MSKISNYFYSIPRFLFISFYRMLIRVKVFNNKNIPKDKPAILAINHTTGADPIIILTAIKKKIYFIADSENFRFRFTNFFMRKFTNSIPVFKKQFSKNIHSFRELFALNKGKPFFYGIFPEGKLNKEGKISELNKGAAYLSYKTKLPIIPVYMHNLIKGPAGNRWLGKNRVFEGIFSLIANAFRRINIFIGEPIYPVASNIMENVKGLADKKTYKHIIDDIQRALEEEFFELESESRKISENLSVEDNYLKKSAES